MSAVKRMLDTLLNRDDLDEAQAAALLHELTSPDMPAALAGAVLTALRAKGVTAVEVRGFATAMRTLARRLPGEAGADAIDIVGTGGDASGSFNLSTGAALLTAACGLRVIKHGNRSITSRSGSADLLEQLGFALPLDERQASACLEASGFTFLFAPYYHPAMKAIAPIRAALGVRTVFNLLGPLTNPSAPRFRLIGAYDAPTAELMAHSLAGGGDRGAGAVDRAWVVHGADGWDEATPIGPFLSFEVEAGRVTRREVDPRGWGLATCTAADLRGGDAAHNLRALRAVFDGSDRGAHRTALLLQAGLALYIGRRAPSVIDGIHLARTCLDTGRAQAWLQELTATAARLPQAARRDEVTS